MELRHLRYFVAVAEEENITRAAERLHLSQPPLSRQIRDLEEEIGVALLERNAKSIRLTRAGRVFLDEARAVLWRADQAVTAAQAAENKVELHLGYAPSPTGEFLSPVLQAFERMMPEVRVVLHDQSSSEMLAGLRAGSLQAALIVEPSGRLLGGVRFERLHSSPMGVIVSRSHRLAKRRRVKNTEIRNEPLVVFTHNEYPDYQKMVRAALGSPPGKLRIVEECDGALSLIAAVEAARGVAVSARSIMWVGGSRVVFSAFEPGSAAAQCRRMLSGHRARDACRAPVCRNGPIGGGGRVSAFGARSVILEFTLQGAKAIEIGITIRYENLCRGKLGRHGEKGSFVATGFMPGVRAGC